MDNDIWVVKAKAKVYIIASNSWLTFKDLRKRVSLEVSQQQSRLSERLRNKPFWIWNIDEHKQGDIKTNGDCCFNHIIALPQKDGNDNEIRPAIGERSEVSIPFSAKMSPKLTTPLLKW